MRGCQRPPRCPRPAPTGNLGCRMVNLGDRVVRPPLGPEPVGDRLEVRLEDGLQHELERGLDHLVRHGGMPSFSASPTRRAWESCVPAPATAETYQPSAGPAGHPGTPGHPTRSSTSHDCHAIYAGSVRAPVARDPVVRHIQRRRVIHEVEQVIEPAAGIGRRPTVKFGLHLRYPRQRALLGPGGAPPFIGASFGITASFPSRNRCRPSPCARALPGSEYYGGSAPPGPFSRRRAQPGHRAGYTATGQDQAVPVFTVIRSTKEEPSSIPAASPRLPRSTSPWPPGSHPHARPGVPRPL